MNYEPSVSVILTTYKGDWRLKRAIESVLSQSYNNIDLIVIDDNGLNTESGKETELLIQPYLCRNGFRYIKHEINKNGATARNTGISVATGDYFAFLDDDDIYERTKIEKCVNAIKRNPKLYNAAYTGVLKIAGEDCIEKFIPCVEGDFQSTILRSHGALGSGSNIFVRADIVKECNGFDESFRRYQDIEFMIRASKKIYIVPVKEVLIIKDNTEMRFFPNFDGLKRAQQQFLEKFSGLIADSVYKSEIYYNKLSELLLYAYKCANKVEIMEAWQLFDQQDGISSKTRFKIKIKGYILKHHNSVIYKMYAKMKRAALNRTIRRSLSETELQFLNRVNGELQGIRRKRECEYKQRCNEELGFTNNNV